tara:strand:- start:765 stop:1133 length:369 start_codon:yes stop_codon:yes gene_type:complete
MSKIEKQIKIGYQKYDIDIWPETFATTEEAVGEFFNNDRKIGLRGDYVETLHGANTLLHEIMHGIVYQYGMVQTMEKFDKEEKIVNTLTNGIMNVFVDNPWLMDYIKEQIDKEYGASSSKTE